MNKYFLVIDQGTTSSRIVLYDKHFKIFDIIQKEFSKIFEDITRFSERFSNIDKRNTQLTEDFRKLQISVDAITNRAKRVKDLEFDKKDLINQ